MSAKRDEAMRFSHISGPRCGRCPSLHFSISGFISSSAWRSDRSRVGNSASRMASGMAVGRLTQPSGTPRTRETPRAPTDPATGLRTVVARASCASSTAHEVDTMLTCHVYITISCDTASLHFTLLELDDPIVTSCSVKLMALTHALTPRGITAAYASQGRLLP